MWKLSAFVLSCLLLMATASPIEKEAESKPIILEAIDLPTESASAEAAALSSALAPAVSSAIAPAVLPAKPSDGPKPAEQANPSESTPNELTESSSTALPTVTTFVEAVPDKLPPPRRQVHYDQRQDGKFNIRADLENFVILVVPSSGTSLLDLLKRSNQKPRHHKRTHTKTHKKYYSATTTVKTSGGKNKKDSNRFDYLRPESTDAQNRPVGGEFIEGRTPYHVDISSAEISQLTPTSVADLPLANNPSVVEATVFLPAQIKGNAYARNLELPTALAIYPRHRKSLTTNDDQHINTNSVSLTPIKNDNNNYNQHAINIINDNINNGNGNGNGNGNDDVKNQSEILTAPDFYSLNMANIDPLALATDAKTTTNNSRLELTLLGAQEQCGPDRRRDSYGICQFFPQDYAT